MAQENAKGPSQQPVGGGGKKGKDRELSIQDLLAMTTGSNVAALESAAKGKVETSGGVGNWPGARYRQYARWFIQTKHPRNKQTIIIAGAPTVIMAYRTCAAVMLTGAKKWPDVILNRSTKYFLDQSQAIPFMNERQGASDLYADTFGRPEEWTIVPCLVRTDKYDERGNKLKGQDEKFCFIEIEPGSALLAEFKDAMSRTFFKNRKAGIVGAIFDVTRLDDKVASYGVWKMRMKEDKKTGSLVPEVFELENLLKYILQQSKQHIGDGNSNKRALYPATLDEAYPYATPDQQKMVLSTHFDIIDGHPDFRRRFKEPLKSWKQDLSGGAVQLDTSKAADDGTAISLDTLDGAATEEATTVVAEEKSDNTEPTLAEAADEAEAAPAAEDGEETVELTVNDDGTFALPDGTPCDEDGNPLEEPAEESEEGEEGEEGEEENTSEDGQQEAAGASQVEGDVTAFDLTEPEKPKTKAVPKATTTAPAKPAPKAAPKAPAPKVEPKKPEPKKTVTKKKPA